MLDGGHDDVTIVYVDAPFVTLCFAFIDLIEVVFKVGCSIPFSFQELFHFGVPVIVKRDYIVVEMIEDLVDIAGGVAGDGKFQGFDPHFINCIVLYECSFNTKEHFVVIDFDFVGSFSSLDLGFIGVMVVEYVVGFLGRLYMKVWSPVMR